MLRSTLCILLLLASSTVASRDLRLQSHNGEEGTCPAAEADIAGEAKPAAAPTAAPAKRTKPPTTVRGGDNTRTQGLRWHSFLPGMFR